MAESIINARMRLTEELKSGTFKNGSVIPLTAEQQSAKVIYIVLYRYGFYNWAIIDTKINAVSANGIQMVGNENIKLIPDANSATQYTMQTSDAAEFFCKIWSLA